MGLVSPSLPLAVHVSDGILTAPWWVGGFLVMGLLALFGAWRMRDEEIPRVAVLTAAFFVATLIHVPVPAGPRTHLLLNGLLGVVLGRRALVAIPVALFLQAALFGHGGLSALGVNACVMGLPALLAGLLFAGLRRLPGIRRPLPRGVLVGGSVAVFSLSLIYASLLLYANFGSRGQELDLALANRLTFHPATLAAVFVLSCLAAWGEAHLGHAPEFPLGLVVGEAAVAATILLHGLVLMWGGEADWHEMVLLTVIVHLPLAVIEGLILGFTVGFLVRVKPELLADWKPLPDPVCPANVSVHPGANGAVKAPHQTSPVSIKPPVLLITVLAALGAAGPARAHNLLAEHKVLAGRKVAVESWFDLTGDSPRGARVQVFRPNHSLLVEGQLNGAGTFVFSYEKAEPLRVVVSAGDGHRAEVSIPASELERGADASPAHDTTGEGQDSTSSSSLPFADRGGRYPLKDVLIGFSFLLALAAFLISWRNARMLREWKREKERRNHSPPN
jgi:cobalt/nickel transport system permease protein